MAVDKTAYLSTKEVPSTTLLKSSGSLSVTKNRELLIAKGFPLLVNDETHKETPPRPDRASADLSSMSYADTDFQDDTLQMEVLSPCSPDEEEVFLPEGNQKGKKHYRIDYDNPWNVHALRDYKQLKGEKPPKTLVWSGDGYRIQDQIPTRLLGKKWDGPKTRIRFADVRSLECKLHMIYKHTHWGSFICKQISEPGTDREDFSLFCASLKGKLKALLQGKPNPFWKREEVERIYGPKWEVRSLTARACRLIEVLKTIDGIFLSRYLSFPNERWTWYKYDCFIVWNLYHLIDDEFYDGELFVEPNTVHLFYRDIKEARKLLKSVSFKKERLKDWLKQGGKLPTWLNWMLRIWREVITLTDTQYVSAIGMLVQTRACGTPPSPIVIQSKVDFLKGISVAPPPLTEAEEALIVRTMDTLILEVPDQCLTGLSTKSSVNITGAASFEHTRRDGGTLQTIQDLLYLGESGRPVPIRNLESGTITMYKTLDEMTHGEYIFWTCLEEVLATPPEILRECYVAVVREPGKARVITKAHAALKVLLDWVNGICSHVLGKTYPSSRSGMRASNHGWNFFVSLTRKEMEVDPFKIRFEETEEFVDAQRLTTTFEDLYVSSTDYKEATDNIHLRIANIIGVKWMSKCGIPKILRAIVVQTCYKPRLVKFTAMGNLRQIGEPIPGKDSRMVTLRRGIMMGDPLTKVILHFTNMITRRMSRNLMKDPDFIRQISDYTIIDLLKLHDDG